MTDHSEARNNWHNPAIPNSGWNCIHVFDAYGASDMGDLITCQMCNSRQIRYVHVMAHPDFEGTLDCGCICASQMEYDHEAARARERDFKNRLAREKRAAARVEREALVQARKQAERAAELKAAHEAVIRDHQRDRRKARLRYDRWGRTRKGGYRACLSNIDMLLFEKDGGWRWMADPHWREKPVWGRESHGSVADAWQELTGRVDRMFEYRIRRLSEEL